MGAEEAIKKLEVSNQGLKVILENLDEQLNEIRSDPKLAGMVDDLETLFYAYLKTWIKSNTEILEILKKRFKTRIKSEFYKIIKFYNCIKSSNYKHYTCLHCCDAQVL